MSVHRLLGGSVVAALSMAGLTYLGSRYMQSRTHSAGYTKLAMELLNEYPHAEKCLGIPIVPGHIVFFGDKERFASWSPRSGIRRLKLPVHGFHSSGYLYVWAKKLDMTEPDDSIEDIWQIERLDLALPKLNGSGFCRWTFYDRGDGKQLN